MSDPEALELLWQRFLAGETLPDADSRALLEAMKSDEALRARFLHEAQMDGWLRTFGRSEAEGEAPVRRFLDGLNAEQDATRFIHKVQSRMKDAGTRRTRWRLRAGATSPSRAWITGFVAAAAILLVIVMAVVNTRPPHPLSPPPAPVVEVPESDVPTPVPPRNFPEPPPAPRPRLEERPRSTDPAPLLVPPPRSEAPRPAPEKPPPLPPPTVPPAVEPPKGPETPREKSRVVFATLEQPKGEVFVVRSGTRTAARNGRDLSIGDRIVTGPKGSALIAFTDSTRVEVDGEVELRAPSEQRGKLIHIERGTVLANVVKQPAGLSMAFLSRHGEATVVGTSLKITVDDLSMRVEVREGKVRVSREGKSVLVEAGRWVEAKAGSTLVVHRQGLEEILVLPKDGRIFKSADWVLVDDPEAVSGKAFEAPQTWNGLQDNAGTKFKSGTLGHLDFTFQAEAGRWYYLWIRGKCTASEGGFEKERFRFDYVGVEFFNADVQCPIQKQLNWNERLWKYNGWGMKDGYNWIAGDADPRTAPGALPMDAMALAVRFQKPGPQLIRIYPVESPMRIDALWLSATQKDRPADDQKGPK